VLNVLHTFESGVKHHNHYPTFLVFYIITLDIFPFYDWWMSQSNDQLWLKVQRGPGRSYIFSRLYTHYTIGEKNNSRRQSPCYTTVRIFKKLNFPHEILFTTYIYIYGGVCFKINLETMDRPVYLRNNRTTWDADKWDGGEMQLRNLRIAFVLRGYRTERC
jgi:hypothetical protein